MLFTKLKMNYFGRFHNREIELKPGINLIYGKNEAGKSTIHTFIKGMLFGIERMRGRGSATKEDLYTRYLPWDYPGAFSGSMDINIGEKEYRLQRSFHANDKNFTITDLSTGREVKLKEGLISEVLPGLTESAFKNTISIEQLKAQTDSELAAQVRNYLANLSIAKSNVVNVTKAVSMLNDQRKQLELLQNPAALKALQVSIGEGLSKEESMDQLTLQLKELLIKEQQLKEQKEAAANFINSEAADRMEQLPAILEKFRSYQELSIHLEETEQLSKELQARNTSGKKEQFSVEALKSDIKDTELLRMKQAEQEKQELELQRERNIQQNSMKKAFLLILLPIFTIMALVMILTGYHPIAVTTATLIFCAGISAYILLIISSLKKQRSFHDRETELIRQKKEVQAGLDRILKNNQVTHPEDLSGKQEEVLKNFYSLEHIRQQLKEIEHRKRGLEDNRDVLYETIMKYMQYFITEEELSVLSMQKLQEVIRQRKQETSDKLSEATSLYDSCKLQIEKLKWEISMMEGNEEQLIKNQERYNALEQSQKENVIELEAVKLALVTIQGLSADIHDSFGQQLNQAVSEVISEVTGNKYNDLKIDEKLEVKVGWNGDYVLLDRLSAGTIDQVYFALRLAVADILLGTDEIPLLLDDSFALYDDTRVKAALARISQRKQILLFTCHKREQRLLKELGLNYHMIDLSCN